MQLAELSWEVSSARGGGRCQAVCLMLVGWFVMRGDVVAGVGRLVGMEFEALTRGNIISGGQVEVAGGAASGVFVGVVDLAGLSRVE